jgi:hypothetical protein
MTINEKVGYQERMRRSKRMHAIIHKLLKLKKNKEHRFAPAAVLKKRAQKLARIMLRQKVAGVDGNAYHKLNMSQRIHVDEFVDKIPKKRLADLAKRLIPVVTRAESERVKQVKSRKKVNESLNKSDKPKEWIDDFLDSDAPQFKDKSKKKKIQMALAAYYNKQNEEVNEAHVSNRARLRRKNKLELKQMFIKRGRQIGKLRKSEKAMDIAIVAKARAAVEREMGLTKGEGPYAKEARGRMIDKGRNRVSKKIRKSKNRKIAKRSHHEKLSGPQRASGVQRRFDNYATLANSYDYDIMADYLIEGNTRKLHDLFLRGLVDRDKLEIYKRVFRDLDDNIKLVRYQPNIAEILEKLVDIVTGNDEVYRRVRQDLIAGKYTGS